MNREKRKGEVFLSKFHSLVDFEAHFFFSRIGSGKDCEVRSLLSVENCHFEIESTEKTVEVVRSFLSYTGTEFQITQQSKSERRV